MDADYMSDKSSNMCFHVNFTNPKASNYQIYQILKLFYDKGTDFCCHHFPFSTAKIVLDSPFWLQKSKFDRFKNLHLKIKWFG